MLKIAIISNPTSGRYSPERVTELAHAFEAEGVSAHHVQDAPFSAQWDIAGADHVCIMGGDGTVRDVCVRLRKDGLSPTLSISPAGTINLIARELGYCIPAAALAQRVMSGAPSRPLYAARVNDQLFLACASIGPDAEAVNNVSIPFKKRFGRFAYPAAMAGLLRHWPRPTLSITVDGQHLAGEAVYIAKAKYYAGPWSFAPEARIDAPLLHILILPKARRRDFARFMAGLVLGAKWPQSWHQLTCQRIEIASDVSAWIQADGDAVAQTPVTITVLPDPFSFC